MAGKGAFDFIYTNHIFIPANAGAGYRVFVQPVSTAIKGQIVVLANSPIHSLEQLQNKTVAFASPAAFAGYAVPMNAFLRAQIKVTPDFAGNQEGAMAQLKAGKVLAAGVNSEVMRDYAEREFFKYRVLWESDSYRNVPIAALPSVPAEKVKAVQEAFVKMDADPVGHKILVDSAAIIKLDPPYGFIHATDKDYANYREFYKTNLIKDF